MGDARERRLADLRARNERREEEMHQRNLCTDQPPFPERLRLEALIDLLVPEEMSLDFQIAVEERRAALHDELAVMIERAQAEAARQELTRGVGSMSTASPGLHGV